MEGESGEMEGVRKEKEKEGQEEGVKRLSRE